MAKDNNRLIIGREIKITSKHAKYLLTCNEPMPFLLIKMVRSKMQLGTHKQLVEKKFERNQKLFKNIIRGIYLHQPSKPTIGNFSLRYNLKF